jgi:predicted nucleotidyltransferase
MGIIIPIMGNSIPSSVISLSNALFGETRQAVLRLLYGHSDERFYQGQIISALNLGSGTVQRELVRLSDAGILTKEVEGRQTYYQANAACPIFEELRSLTKKTVGAPTVIFEALSELAPKITFAFIYGSVAKGNENMASDIDLMIVSDKLNTLDVVKSLINPQKELNREINSSHYSIDEFFNNIAKGDHFLTNVIKNPKVFLIGDEGELQRMVKKRMADKA